MGLWVSSSTFDDPHFWDAGQGIEPRTTLQQPGATVYPVNTRLTPIIGMAWHGNCGSHFIFFASDITWHDPRGLPLV
jgi:hypothetical protein